MTTLSRTTPFSNAQHLPCEHAANGLAQPVLRHRRGVMRGRPRWTGEFVPLWARGGEGGVSRITAFALFDPGGESGFWQSTGPTS